MLRRELEYVDSRDPSSHQAFIIDAPTLLQGLPQPDLRAVHSSTVKQPPALQKRAKTQRPPQESLAKRSHDKTTLPQMLGLLVELERVGNAQSDVEVSTKFGIPLKNTQKQQTIFRRDQSILPKSRYERKSRVISYQHIVKQLLVNDPSITIKKLPECLICDAEGTKGDGEK